MKHSIRWIAFCATSLIVSDASVAQTLSQAAKTVAHREPELRAVGFDTASSYHQYQSTKGQRRPHVFLDGSAGYSSRSRSVDGLVRNNGDALFQRDIGLSLRQLLFDGGQSRNQVLEAKHAVCVQKLLERSMIEARLVDLAEVYLEVFRANQQIDAAYSNIKTHREIASRLKTGSNLGNKPEIALVEGRIGSAQRELALQKLALENAENRFQRLVGHRPSKLTFPKIPTLASSSANTDLSNNWDYLAAQEGVKVAEHRLKSFKAAHGPKVYFDTGYSRGVDAGGIRGNDDEARALLTFDWDLYKGGEKKQLKNREIFQLEKAKSLLQAADEERKYRNVLLWQERVNATNSIGSLSRYRDRVSSATNGYEQRFEVVGKESLLGILDLQSETYRANSQLIDAKFERDTSAYRILGNQGRLTKLLGVDYDYEKHAPETDIHKALDTEIECCPIPVSLETTDTTLQAATFGGKSSYLSSSAAPLPPTFHYEEPAKKKRKLFNLPKKNNIATQNSPRRIFPKR